MRPEIQAGPFIPLNEESRPTVTTAAAAFHLCRRPQTLRIWACKESGPIRPIRINGRLAWPVSELRRLLKTEPAAGRPLPLLGGHES